MPLLYCQVTTIAAEVSTSFHSDVISRLRVRLLSDCICPSDMSQLVLFLLGRGSLYPVLLVAFIVLLCIFYTLQPKKQRYAAAPITCITDKLLAMAMERFKTDAQGMLREGHEQ